MAFLLFLCVFFYLSLTCTFLSLSSYDQYNKVKYFMVFNVHGTDGNLRSGLYRH